MSAEFVDPESYMKPIGIVSGRGVLATDDIERNIRREARKIFPHGLPILRRDFPTSLLSLEKDGTISKPPRASQRLLSVVAEIGPLTEFFIIAAHAPDVSRRAIEEFAGRQGCYLSMVDITLQEINSKPEIKRVGIIGYSTTVQQRLYQEPLEASGLECVTVPEEMSGWLDEAIDDVVENGASVDVLEPAARLACTNLLYAQGVQRIILACTELPLVLPLKGINDYVLINPNQLIAEAAVQKAVSRLQEANYPFPTPGVC